MTTLLLIIWIVLVIGLIVSLAVRPVRTRSSHFELERLHDTAALRRERLLGGVFALRRVVILLVTVFASVLSVAVFGDTATLAMIIVIILAIPISRIRFVAATVQRYYARYEAQLLAFVEKNIIVGWFMLPGDKSPRDHGPESTELLTHHIMTAPFLSDDQRTILTRGIDWHQTTIESVMTPRSRIASIRKGELLGPLVLDDLHKTGHSQFPVTKTKGNVDEIVGVLDVTDLLELTASRSSQTVEEVMVPKVLRIEADEALPAALAMLQKSHFHMLIVTNVDGKTVGLVTLADITTSLLGKTEVK